MPQDHPLAAVHYFYVLKDDQEDMEKLWSRLAAGAAGRVEQPALPDLTAAEEGPAGYCRIVHRVRGEDLDLCLVMLADLSVMQVLYHIAPEGTLEERWAQALRKIEEDRDKVLGGMTIFGETTLLVFEGDADEQFSATVAAVSGEASTILKSDIIPAVAGGGRPLLLHLLDGYKPGMEPFALAAREPDTIVSTLFPQVDSIIKKLVRAAAYFDDQRNTIIRERTGVDREIGALLHRQVVVSATGERTDPAALEKQIDSLSHMFGVLATDSLLVRQAGDRLEADTSQLQRVLDTLCPIGADEIGAHYLGRFRGALESVKDEARNLHFSRQNAQAGIEVVRTQVELLRAGEEAAVQAQTKELLSHSLVLQKERMALQVAAGFVEFVLVFYYVLKSWEGIAGLETVEHISPVNRMAVVGCFAVSAAVGTHFLAQSLSSRSWRNPGLWISVAVLVLSFTAMVILTVVNS